MDILEDNNYQLDTRPQGAKTLEKMANTVKSLTTEPRSVSNVINQNISLNPLRDNVFADGTWSGQTDYLAKNTPYGYFQVPVPYSGEFSPFSLGKTLLNPKSLKTSNIKEIVLDININTQQIPYNSGSAVPTSPFSIKYYVVIGSLIPDITYLEPVTLELPPNSPYGTLTFFEFTFNVDFYGGIEYWYISNAEQSRSLSKATLSNGYNSDGSQNFDVDPIGIRPECYELFKNNPLSLSIVYGFDRNDVEALSGTSTTGNKGYAIQSHIQDNPYWRNIININFSYFGLLIPYTPY